MYLNFAARFFSCHPRVGLFVSGVAQHFGHPCDQNFATVTNFELFARYACFGAYTTEFASLCAQYFTPIRLHLDYFRHDWRVAIQGTLLGSMCLNWH